VKTTRLECNNFVQFTLFIKQHVVYQTCALSVITTNNVVKISR